jgi:uncharacterized membrane protein (DUF4010 family)
MEEILVFMDFLIAMALGALIGMEREMAMWKSGNYGFAGVRTFVLITLLGALIAYISKSVGQYSLVFVAIAFVAFAILISTSYYVTARFNKKIGATTEVTALLAFIIGVMCMYDMKTLAVAITIMITTLLAFKKILHGFAHRINRVEVYATLEFLLVSLVILPFLPNEAYGPFNAFNPYNIWLMVVFVSAISYAGYVLIKWKGADKGLGLLGFVGGLVSSTAVASTMAHESKKGGAAKPFAFASILSSIVMLFRVGFIVYVINKEILPALAVPLAAMAVSGTGFALITRNHSKQAPKVAFESPLALAPALKFAAFFALILLISKVAQMYYGASGVYVVAVLAGLADVNAITITIAGMALTGALGAGAAAVGIILAVISNTIVKIWLGHLFGSKEFSSWINLAYVTTILVGIIALLISA